MPFQLLVLGATRGWAEYVSETDERIVGKRVGATQSRAEIVGMHNARLRKSARPTPIRRDGA